MPINIEDLTIDPILKSINCTLKDHSLTIIIGRSGSGKSTFIQAIAGLMKLGTGAVSYNRIPLWNKKKVNREVLLQHAIAFQYPEHQLFSGTVQEEFDYTLRPYRVSRVECMDRTCKALGELRLSQSILHQSPLELSGGQKRSVAVATLLATDSAWLFLDEPTAGLDARIAARLREQLAVWKLSRGILMVTHDWEFFLPIADRILVMADGHLLADVTSAELKATPSLLHQAGMGVPNSLKVACELQKSSVPMSAVLLSPAQMAEAIIDQWEGNNPYDINGVSKDEMSESICNPIVHKPAAEEEVILKPRLYRIGARRKWLMYMVLSVLILLQNQWSGLIVAMIAAFGTLSLLQRKHALQALRLCKPLLFFIVVASLFAGIEVSLADSFRLGFDISAWLLTIQRMLPFLAVTLISFVFTLSTSTVEMQVGLEKALSVFERFGIPTKMFSLAASLVLRFIPMILMEAERFSLIAAARGKRVVRRGQIHFRDIRVFTIPLLISLFQMVEDFILAIEIKGFKDKRKRGGS